MLILLFFTVLIGDSLITEWRIQKRVEEQFNAFVTGFNELIPPDLVNVFDERELELLIGGIADIDVEDWKKHTDYRGYTEQDEVIKNFWTVCLAACLTRKAFTDQYSASEAGTLSRSLVSYSSLLGRLAFLSTDSKTFKEVTGPDDLQSKNLDRTRLFPSHILGKQMLLGVWFLNTFHANES